jgi:hypothetical protein
MDQLTISCVDGGYAKRTVINAQSAFTIAIALDFNTSGEKLTKRSSSKGLIAIPFTTPKERAAAMVIDEMRMHYTHDINIAGNSLYTYYKRGYSQHDVNVYVYEVLKIVHKLHGIDSIRSGGQSGADFAGLVAGVMLGVPTIGLYPHKYLMRDASGKDYQHEKEQILDKVIESATNMLYHVFNERLEGTIFDDWTNN